MFDVKFINNYMKYNVHDGHTGLVLNTHCTCM